jgi:hypothetical protein
MHSGRSKLPNPCTQQTHTHTAPCVPVLAFTYIDDAASLTYPLMEKLRQVLVQHALQHNSSDKAAATSVFNRIASFEEELKVKLTTEVPQIREAYDNKGYSPVPNRIEDCRTYPLYKFVRQGLHTQLLTGLRTIYARPWRRKQVALRFQSSAYPNGHGEVPVCPPPLPCRIRSPYLALSITLLPCPRV